MRRDAMRTLLVVSDRPHPWVYLRDRLDPELVTVAWAKPDAADGSGAGVPWLLAGDGRAGPAALGRLRGRVLGCRWVGAPPAGLPVPALVLPDWAAVAADAERGLAATVAGVRLAPGSGLVLPDGSFTAGVACLEALLSAHPAGLPAAGPGLAPAIRRMQALLDRHGVPLKVAHASGMLRLAAA